MKIEEYLQVIYLKSLDVTYPSCKNCYKKVICVSNGNGGVNGNKKMYISFHS